MNKKNKNKLDKYNHIEPEIVAKLMAKNIAFLGNISSYEVIRLIELKLLKSFVMGFGFAVRKSVKDKAVIDILKDLDSISSGYDREFESLAKMINRRYNE